MTGLSYEQELDLLRSRLTGRLEGVHLSKRLNSERRKEARSGSSQSPFSWKVIKRDLGRVVMRKALWLSGTLGRGQRNLLSPRLVDHRLVIPGLPSAFEGFRLLHLSDLHLDMNDGLSESLVDQVGKAQYDLCVITGDFRARTFGPIDNCMRRLRHVRQAIKTDVYAVLGNHDSIRMIPLIEAMNIRLLLNESTFIERGTARLGLGGVDDPHYYGVDDLARVLAGLPRDEPRILLAHSPELFESAAAGGFHAYLCGHTHGGQICLPGGMALINNARAPRAYCAGPWCHQGMRGYTSRGSGASIVDVRFNCPPEITVHTLSKSAG